MRSKRGTLSSPVTHNENHRSLSRSLTQNDAIRYDVVRVIQAKLVNFLLRNKLFNVDDALALDCDGFELFGV